MHIVKRKYIVKAVAVFLFLLAVISGIFLSVSAEQRRTKDEIHRALRSTVTELYAVFEEINTAFSKAESSGDYTAVSKEIYAKALVARNIIFNGKAAMENTSARLAALADYALTDMTDSDKNNLYLQQIKNACLLLRNECTNFNNQESIIAIEKHFEANKNNEYYNSLLKSLEEQYSVLENTVTAERKEIADYARRLLGYPLAPPLFKGAYTAPKSVVYTLRTSYADIYPSGKILSRMASHDPLGIPTSSKSSPDEEALKHLSTHAYYAADCIEVYSHRTESSAYFIFCPKINVGGTIVINCNEPIKLSVSIIDGSLKAFDSTKYLKNHKALSISPEDLPSPITISEQYPNLTLQWQNTALIGENYYVVSKLTHSNGSAYYHLSSKHGPSEFCTEKEYLKISGLL